MYKKNKKTIVYIADSSNIHTIRWLNYFKEQNYRIFILTFQYKKNNKVGVIPLRKDNIFVYVVSIIKAFFILRRIKPSFIHAHYATSYGLVGALSFYRPLVMSVWGSDIYEFPRKSFFHRLIIMYVLKVSNYICSTSKDMAEEVGKYSRKNIYITPFGIDCAEYQPQHTFSNSEIIIGTIKKLEPIYGIKYLIESFALLKKKYPLFNLKLVIVGDGDEKKELVMLTNQLLITKDVSFVGKVSQDKVKEYLNSFSIFAALSLSESFGVAVIEASACALPVVTSNVGGLPEVVVSGVTGYIVPSKDVESAALAFEKLVIDPDLRQLLGKQGRDFVMNNFEISITSKIMESVYRIVVREM